MQEIGGFLELEHYSDGLYHEKAIKLNTGRNCLELCINLFHISSIWLPDYMCDAVFSNCKKNNVAIHFYTIDKDFDPVFPRNPESNDYLYLCNYYGQITPEVINQAIDLFQDRIILDNIQSFYTPPANSINTIYSCRKYFGVPDGAFLYCTSAHNAEVLLSNIPQDQSFDSMQYILGRFEKTASDFFHDYQNHESLLENKPLRKMSKLTENLLRSINYDEVKRKRERNWLFLHNACEKSNELNLHCSEGPYVYPLLIRNADQIRKELIQNKIYIPTLWPNTAKSPQHNTWSYYYSNNLLPLPIDQRYDTKDLIKIIDILSKNNAL